MEAIREQLKTVFESPLTVQKRAFTSPLTVRQRAALVVSIATAVERMTDFELRDDLGAVGRSGTREWYTGEGVYIGKEVDELTGDCLESIRQCLVEWRQKHEGAG